MTGTRRRRASAISTLVALLVLVPATGTSLAEDWPQHRGPQRDGRSSWHGLQFPWDDSGPRELWRVPIGRGFSGVSVADGRLFTLDSRKNGCYGVALDSDSGSELWRVRLDDRLEEFWGDGPRSTPTVDGDRVYLLTGLGRLVALRAADGARLWQVDLPTAFGSALPMWGFSGSPIVFGELIVFDTGGTDRRSIVALDKYTGELRWSTFDDAISYSSPIVIPFAGRDVLVFLTGMHIVGLDADGRRLFAQVWGLETPVRPATPVFVAPDALFVSASYGAGGSLLRLRDAGKTIDVETVWSGRAMRNHFHATVAHQGHLYGFDRHALKCIEAETGKACWSRLDGMGRGSLIYADGHLLVLTEHGRLVAVEAQPVEFHEKGSLRVFQDRSWTAPALADGRIYLRNESEIVCLDLRP